MDRLTLPPVTNDKPFPNDWSETIDHRFDERDRELFMISLGSSDIPDGWTNFHTNNSIVLSGVRAISQFLCPGYYPLPLVAVRE